MLTGSPRYELSAPMFIGSRLAPSVKVAGATLTAEAHAVERDGRAHFRFFLDVPEVGTWESDNSYSTVMAATWTEAAAMALETFADVASTDDPADNSVLQDLPETLKTWVTDNSMNFYSTSESLREWLYSN